jgi:hypothetical protein
MNSVLWDIVADAIYGLAMGCDFNLIFSCDVQNIRLTSSQFNESFIRYLKCVPMKKLHYSDLMLRNAVGPVYIIQWMNRYGITNLYSLRISCRYGFSNKFLADALSDLASLDFGNLAVLSVSVGDLPPRR